MPAPNGAAYVRDIETAERDAAIARYWTRDRSCQQVADHFGINKSTVSRARQRAIDAAVIPAGREAIAAENLELDQLATVAWAVLHSFHVHVADGQVVRDDGKPVEDMRPILQAMDRILRIQERRARLNGLDAPSRAEVRVTDDLTAQIEELARELGGVAGGDAGPDRSVAGRSEERTPGPAPSPT